VKITDQRCIRRIILRCFAAGWILVGLALLGALLWRAQLRWQVERQVSLVHQAGFPASAEELNSWRAPVPDAENASLLITQAFALLRTFPDERSNWLRRITLPVRGGCPDDLLFEWMAGYVRMNAPALAKAREAVRRPRARYLTDFTGGWTAESHPFALFDLKMLAEMEGLVAAQHGQRAAAVESTLLLLSLARTLDGEPRFFSQCTRLDLVRTAVRTLESALTVPPASDSCLNGVAQALADADRTNLFQLALVGERALLLSSIWRQSDESYRRQQGEMADLERIVVEGLLGPDFNPMKPIDWALGLTDRDALKFLKDTAAEYQSWGLPWPQRLDATNCSANRDAAVTAHLRAAQLGVAVEQFRLTRGRLPAELCELVPDFIKTIPQDPFDGRRLRYKLLEKGFVVYSIGVDRRDDGGRERPNPWPNGHLVTDELPAWPRGRTRARAPVPPHDIVFLVER